eukprot:maker-scaffold_14-snap-gene-6.54-mRNA-1 protein AED:0.00 eAED:0.00 QI:58/1/1/1/1/1/2/167/679
MKSSKKNNIRRNEKQRTVLTYVFWVITILLYLTYFIKSSGYLQTPSSSNLSRRKKRDDLKTPKNIFDTISPKEENEGNFLNIIVISDVKDIKHRQAIRSSWMELVATSPKSFRSQFCLKGYEEDLYGLVSEENKIHKDIILSEGTPATLLACLTLSSQAKNVIVVDDLTYLNLVELEGLIKYEGLTSPFVVTIPENQDAELSVRDNSFLTPFLVDQAALHSLLADFSKLNGDIDRSNLFHTLSTANIPLFTESMFCDGRLGSSQTAYSCNPFHPERFVLRTNVKENGQKFLHNTFLARKTSVWTTIGSHETERVESLVSIIVKCTLKYRKLKVLELIKSIRKFYPTITVLVADDSGGDNVELIKEIDSIHTKVIYLPENCGLSHGRNVLVKHVETKYTLLVDDDTLFAFDTRIDLMLNILEESEASFKPIDLVGGTYENIEEKFQFTETESYGLKFYVDHKKQDLFMAYAPGQFESFGTNQDSKAENYYKCRQVDVTHNFFLARTEALRSSPWRDELIMSEHELFFLDFKKNGKAVVECPSITILHDKQVYPQQAIYKTQSKRYSSFCPAYRSMCSEYPFYRTILTPWHEINCELGFVCHLYGSYNRKQQLNTRNTDWRHDPIRRIFCLRFDHDLCSYDADPNAVEKEGLKSELKRDRKRRPSQRQVDTRPIDYMTTAW